MPTTNTTRRPNRSSGLMSARAIENELARHSRDTGIPPEELRRMCTQAGLDQLKLGELKVSALQFAGAHIDEDTHKALKRLAKTRHRTFADQCRLIYQQAIDGTLKVPDFTAPQAGRQD